MLFLDAGFIYYFGMNSEQTADTSAPATSQLKKRKAHMNRIRQSLKSVTLLHQNVDLVKNVKSSNNRVEMEKFNTKSTSSQENTPEKVCVEKYELFDEKYELCQKLGEGTNGVVRKCRKRQSGEEFAVKIFTFEDEHLPNLKSNFLFMKRLKHPNIIKYQALYIDPKKHQGWLIMELVKIPSLSKAKFKSEEDLQNVMFQIIEVLSYLHCQDIVHRDIKPENILYDPESKVIKLIDFGISKRFRRRGSLTDMWTITGTLYYRAPEMFSGGYREHVDIWAAGILLFKLVTGKTPFESEYHHQTIQNIRGAQLNFPGVFNNYSSDLRSLLTAMLSRNIEERPSSCSCLRHPWLSSIFSSSTLIKTENKLSDKTFQVRREPTSTKCRLQAKMSFEMRISKNFDDDEEEKEDLKESVRPYIKKVNGQEYHIIDEEWQ